MTWRNFYGRKSGQQSSTRIRTIEFMAEGLHCLPTRSRTYDLENSSSILENMGDDRENCLAISGQAFPECDVDAPIRDLPRQDYSHARDAFNKAAKEAEETNRESEARVYQSMAVVCSFHPNF